MSCSYPSCYMGSHSCPYEARCDREAEAERKRIKELRDLELEEARLRVEKLKKELG